MERHRLGTRHGNFFSLKVALENIRAQVVCPVYTDLCEQLTGGAVANFISTNWHVNLNTTTAVMTRLAMVLQETSLCTARGCLCNVSGKAWHPVSEREYGGSALCLLNSL